LLIENHENGSYITRDWWFAWQIQINN
jgi:hypothetical protein